MGSSNPDGGKATQFEALFEMLFHWVARPGPLPSRPMSRIDLIVRGATVVSGHAVRWQDIGVADGRILELYPGGPESARETIDATGLHLFPGVIDSHVHFNDPGRAHWEGFYSGSHAFAAGGGTLFFDMPLNASPPTLDGASFDQKLAAAQAGALADFAFWGGLVPQNLDRLQRKRLALSHRL